MVFLIIVCIVFLFMLISKLTVALSIKGDSSKVIIQIHIFLIYKKLGITKQFIIPNESTKSKAVEETEELNEQQERKNFVQFNNIQIIIRVIQYIRKHLYIIEITDFRWQTHIGTQEAASTGTITGILWTIKYWVAGLLFHTFSPKTVPIIRVTPHFQNTIFQTRLECMFRFRIGKAIKVMFGMIFLIKKLQRKNQINIKNVGKFV